MRFAWLVAKLSVQVVLEDEEIARMVLVPAGLFLECGLQLCSGPVAKFNKL